MLPLVMNPSIAVGEIRPAYADEKRVLARTRLTFVTGVDLEL